MRICSVLAPSGCPREIYVCIALCIVYGSSSMRHTRDMYVRMCGTRISTRIRKLCRCRGPTTPLLDGPVVHTNRCHGLSRPARRASKTRSSRSRCSCRGCPVMRRLLPRSHPPLPQGVGAACVWSHVRVGLGHCGMAQWQDGRIQSGALIAFMTARVRGVHRGRDSSCSSFLDARFGIGCETRMFLLGRG